MCKSICTCYYTVLGVDHSASDAEVKTAFRKLSLIHHPDKLATHSDAQKLAGEEKMKLLNNAYDTLGDPESRRLYDAPLPKPSRIPRQQPDTSSRDPGPYWQPYTSSEAPGGRPQPPRSQPDSRPFEGNSQADQPPKGKPNTKAKAADRYSSSTFKHHNKGWGFSVKMSSKYHVLNDVQDVTTSKMHHISLAFSLKVNENYQAPTDDTKNYDIRINVLKTPGGRDVTSITTLLKECHLKDALKRQLRTLIVTIVCPRKVSEPLQKPIRAFFNFDAPIRPPTQARACATYSIFSREEPPQEIRDFQPSPSSPDFPRACPESHITSLSEIKVANGPVPWVDLKGEKYKVEDCNGEKWHRLTAVGFRSVVTAFDQRT
jgi:curved DNA-binding protein CbpA